MHRLLTALFALFCLLTTRCTLATQSTKAAAQAPPAAQICMLFHRDGDVWGLDRSGHERVLIRHARNAAFSWDGTRIAYVHDWSIWIAPSSDPSAAKRICHLQGSPRAAGDDGPRTTITWDPTGRYLVFSVFDVYRLQTSTPATAGQFKLASIWTVSTTGAAPKPALWIGPRLRGWDTVGTLSASAPGWIPSRSEVGFILGGSVCLAHVTGRRESGQAEPDGPEVDYEWDPTVAIPHVPDFGGSGEAETVGYSRVSVSKSGALLAIASHRLNGGDDHWIEIWTRRTGKDGDTFVRVGQLAGDHPTLMPSGRDMLYAENDNGGIHVRDLGTGKDRLLVKDAEDPEVVPTLDQLPSGL